MIIDKDGIVQTRNLDSQYEIKREQRIDSIKSMIRMSEYLSYALRSFIDNWKRTGEILGVEDLSKLGRTKEGITTGIDFLRKIESLASELDAVSSYLVRILRFYYIE